MSKNSFGLLRKALDSEFIQDYWLKASWNEHASLGNDADILIRSSEESCGCGAKVRSPRWRNGAACWRKTSTRWSWKKSRAKKHSTSDEIKTRNCCWYRLLASNFDRVTVPRKAGTN